MRRILLVLAALCVAAPLRAAAPERQNVLREADRAYRETQYQTAQDGYLRLLRSEGATGHLLYNLGNTAFRLNQTGRAILFYERARLLLPRDADLAYNLGRAREQVRDSTPEPAGLSDTAFFWLGSLTLAEIFWFFAAANVLFWSLLVLRIFLKAEWTHYLLFLLLTVWLLTGMSFWMKWHQVGSDDRAVILQAEVGVLAGPDVRDTVLFKLHEGTVVHLERSEAGWSLIRLPDGKRGWLRSEGAEKIAA
jgi:tetratricopeptide (TPR) repeat protein